MNILTKSSLAARLSLGFGAVLLLLIGLSALSLLRMQTLTSALEEITVTNAARSQTINVMKRELAAYIQTMGDLGSTDLQGGPAVLTQVRSALKNYDAAQQRIAGMLPGDSAVTALLQQVKTAAAAAADIQALGTKSAEGRGLAAEAFLIRGEYANNAAARLTKQLAWGKAVEALSDWQEQANATLSAQATAAAQTARGAIVGGTLLAFALGCALAIWLVRDTRRAIGRAVAETQRMADHDLSQTVHVDRRDEIGQLLTALEQMRLNLHALAAGVNAASSDIDNASGEIAQGSQDLSNRTEDAASTIQTALSAIAQLSASVHQTTESARSARTLSGQASTVAQKSGSEMQQVVSTMDEIDAAAHKIADIIAIIDGIAFQTNILALNAAVEAARAGEQGRGFAVVASEVRALAGRSAAAAKEIKQLVETSLSKVTSGTTQVNRVCQTAQDVSSSVGQVSAVVEDISGKSAEQLEHLGQANQLVEQLDAVAQQNAALAEQSAAAAASLRQQVKQLDDLVHRFKLGAGGPVGAAQRPVALLSSH